MIEHKSCGGKVYRETKIEWKGDEVLFWRGICDNCGKSVEVEYEATTVKTIDGPARL